MRSILVPLDGSRFAERVLPLAAQLADSHHASIRLALVHTPHPVLGSDGGPGMVPDLELRNREAEYLTAQMALLDPEGGRQVSTVHLDGDPGPALEAEAHRASVDLVVIATHGRGAFSRFWLGSVADYLVRHLGVPILLVRPAEEGASQPQFPFNHVLVPLDGSALAEQAIEPALALGTGAAPRFTLMSVIEPVLGVGEPGLPFAVPVDPRLFDEHRRGAELRLTAAAERLGGRGVQVETSLVTAAGVGAAIVEEAQRVGAGLISMMTHGDRGLRRLMLGSVADKVLRGATVPILLGRPAAK
jgi:nucleotide-binding universal stress UspA family protein